MARAGAGQGIGRAFAHALGEAGAAVAVADINGEAAERVASELAAKGVRAISITADVTRAEECRRCPPLRPGSLACRAPCAQRMLCRRLASHCCDASRCRESAPTCHLENGF